MDLHAIIASRAMNLPAYRLITKGTAGLPLALDIYDDNVVIHFFGPVAPQVTEELKEALTKELGIKNLFYKDRIKSKLALPKFAPGRKEIIVHENGLKFLVNLSDYLDTGLFLDHRETRAWIKKQSKGKTVLNTFAYTGSFSIYASAGGAEKTHSVDLSRTYCEWMKKNLALNNLSLEKNWVYKMDTFEFFQYARKKNLRFDIIIIDPPTFSRNKGSSFSLQKDHPRLINEALKLLYHGGFILFSNNCEEFQLNRKALAPCRIEDKTDATTPPDFKGSFAHWCWMIRPV